MAIITIVLLWLILISVWIGTYQLIKQQGRILLRLDTDVYKRQCWRRPGSTM